MKSPVDIADPLEWLSDLSRDKLNNRCFSDLESLYADMQCCIRALVITVTGTNGKGSVCAFLESCLKQAGYRVGAHTSPHLVSLTERITLQGQPIDSRRLQETLLFIRNIALKKGVIISYFDYLALAAFYIFSQESLDVVICEVGLGGRLDPTNLLSPDCVVLTNISLDHQLVLGDTRDSIASEKAGLFRENIPIICADPDPPKCI